MPVVVNELVFRATVAEPAAAGRRRPAAPARPAIDAEALVAACVEEVLRILERRQER